MLLVWLGLGIGFGEWSSPVHLDETIWQLRYPRVVTALLVGMALSVSGAALQALFENPDVLLLDDPTNHLDIMTTDWLEHYLTNEFKGLLLLVSHDTYFLNKVSTNILDID